MLKEVITSSGGIGFFQVLGLLFILLKLTHVISWSWWLVTLPLWGPLVAAVGIFGIVIVVAVVVALCSSLSSI